MVPSCIIVGDSRREKCKVKNADRRCCRTIVVLTTLSSALQFFVNYIESRQMTVDVPSLLLVLISCWSSRDWSNTNSCCGKHPIVRCAIYRDRFLFAQLYTSLSCVRGLTRFGREHWSNHQVNRSYKNISIGRSCNYKIIFARNERCNFFYISKFNNIFMINSILFTSLSELQK